MTTPLAMFGGFQFARPWALAGLLLLPLLMRLAGRKGPSPAVVVPSLRGLSVLGRPVRSTTGWRLWLSVVAPVTLILLALARPRIPLGDDADPSRGIDIMLTLDYSRSMAETDFRLHNKRVSRVEALIEVTKAFIAGRPNDRIGIVCFARTPWLVSPLTLDHEWALASLRESELATGTGIGWAIMSSSRFLQRASDRSRVIILITDGDNSAGPRPLEAVPVALESHIKVYTILIGPEMVTPTAAVNHELNKVARLTGGQFFQANDARALRDIYSIIDQLERRALAQKRFVAWHELYPWFLLPAFGLVAGSIASSTLIRRRLP
jgi:Ca-activated chloride channel homolog